MVEPAVSVELGGRALCRGGQWKAADVREDVAKLYAPVSGRGWISVAGHRVTLTPGQLFLLPPHSRLSWGTPDKILIDYLHFRLEPFWLDNRLAQAGRPMIFHGVAARRWLQLCPRFGAFFQQPTAGLACRVHAMLLEVSAAALERTRRQTDGFSPAAQRLTPALAYLDQHALQLSPPNLEQIAGSLDLSAEHFHRLFRAAIGITPMHYMLKIRMPR